LERRKVRLTIKATLTLAIGLTTALLILGVGIFSYYNTARVVEDAVIREARLVAEKNAEAISEWFRFIEEDMYLFSLVPAVRNLDEARAVMAELIKQRPGYGGILLADKNGTATTVEGLTISIASRDYFEGALAGNKVAYSQPMVTQGTNVATVMLARPVMSEGSTETVGVVAFAVALEELQQLAASMTLQGYGYGWLINEQGVIVGHPSAEYIGTSDLFSADPDLQAIASKMLAGESGVERYGADDGERVIAYAPVNQNGWAIAVEAREADLFQEVARLRLTAAGMIAVALLVGFALAYGLAVSLSKPMVELTKSAERLGAGDLTAEVTV